MKNVVTENSDRSEPASENVTSASTSDQCRRNSRKRKRSDTENSTNSKTSPTNEASSSVDNHGNRESPELGCSICLSAVENRAFTDACYHTFCFECLVEWSRVRAVCPLCKKSFHSIIHSFQSYDDYKLYQVPTSYVSNYVNVSSLNNSEPLNLSRVGRFFNNNNPIVPPVDDADSMLALRRRVYTHSEEMQPRGLWSSDGVVVSPPHPVSPAMFDCYPVMLERVRPWVLRDVAVIIGNGDIQYVANIVLDLLRHFPITSEDFYERLFPYFGLHTRRFLLELDFFARSPFDMTTYDARVVYSTGAGVEESHHLPTEHVEDISSSDDSDIEIVTPAVVVSNESALSSQINTMTDRVVPDLLQCLRTFQHNLLMSFSFMNQHSRHSELDSPVPGPSGLGQDVVADESYNMGSHAPQSVNDVDERSGSPMVLSDADSDIMVVDIDRPVRSPIHISSGEDDITIQRVRTHHGAKRRKRHKHRHAESRSEFEQSDGLTSTADCAAEKDILQGNGALSHGELPHTSRKSADRSDVEKRSCVDEQTENSDHTQNQSSSRSSSARLNDNSSASFKQSSSLCLQMDDGKVADTGRHAFHRAHPKRSRSANSMSNVPVLSLSGTDKVKPVTCKKHISGHKSSKQKARDIVAEKRSAEVFADNAEKSVACERVGAADGCHDSIDAGSNEQSSADLPDEAKVSSVGESSSVCADCSSSDLPVELTSKGGLAADNQLSDGVPVPSTSEICSLPALVSSDFDLDNVQCSSIATVEVTFDAAHQCLPAAEDNLPQCDANACSDSCDTVHIHSVDVHKLPENAATVSIDCVKVNSCETETVTAQSVILPNCMVPSGNEAACGATEQVHPSVTLSSCSNAVVITDLHNLSPPPGSKPEHSDCSSEPSCNVSMSAATSSASNSQLHLHTDEGFKLKSGSTDIADCVPSQNDSSDSVPVVSQASESLFTADNSFQQGSQLTSCLCTDTASSKNWSLLPSCDIRSTVSGTDFDGSEAIDYSLKDRTGSNSSICHDVVDSPASPSPVVNDTILSPVGIESSDSDSEVEWLESGVTGRQRCISISSGGSSVVYSPLHDVESVLSDTDSLEMLDDELQLSVASLDPSAEEQNQTHSNHLLQVDTEPLPSTSDMASSMDIEQMEDVMVREQIDMEHKSESHEDNDTIADSDSANEPSDVPLYINPTADAYNQDTDTDIEELV